MVAHAYCSYKCASRLHAATAFAACKPLQAALWCRSRGNHPIIAGHLQRMPGRWAGHVLRMPEHCLARHCFSAA